MNAQVFVCGGGEKIKVQLEIPKWALEKVKEKYKKSPITTKQAMEGMLLSCIHKIVLEDNPDLKEGESE